MDILLNSDYETYSDLQKSIMISSNKVGAPLGVPLVTNGSFRVHEPNGSRFSPQKIFVDMRNGVKISLGQAKEILAKYERLQNG